jgi:Xaa-Pro aminopeptidase
MPEIHAVRRRRAQELIRESAADAALITARPNVRYLTGLASSNAALLLPAAGDGALLATDSRYAGAARRDAADLELVEDRFIETKLAREASRRGVVGRAAGAPCARSAGRSRPCAWSRTPRSWRSSRSPAS